MRRVIAFLFSATLAIPAVAGTYYIDWSGGSDANSGTSTNSAWKDAPGMAGFAATYAHAAGDRFIFRGGTTWPTNIAVWTISNSGAAGTNDYYGVDTNWFTGVSWSRPVFDGGGCNPIPSFRQYGYWVVGGNYVTIDNLCLTNIGVTGVEQGDYAVKVTSTTGLLIEHCTFAPNANRAIVFAWYGSGNDIVISSNDFSMCCWGVGGGNATTDIVITNFTLAHNTMHDFNSQLVSGVHGDGCYLYASTTNVGTYCANFWAYDNVFYGDFSKYDKTNSAGGMTAFVWDSMLNQGNAYIFNNMATIQNDANVSGAWSCGPNSINNNVAYLGAVYMLNNSYYAGTNCLYCMGFSSVTNGYMLNNVWKGGQSGVNSGLTASNMVVDYNDWNGGRPQVNNYFFGTNSFATWRTLGFDLHSITNDPLFISASNLQLQAVSPAISAGTNLLAFVSANNFPLATNDITGSGRPGNSAWDMGAYQSSTNAPVTPHRIIITSSGGPPSLVLSGTGTGTITLTGQ
ncbi:MAG: hypothetical protein KGJ13_07365 [Patescibacteria group bacterium]|nr:hypothetical protein [Patescibacteria group bacterium]